LHCPSDFREFDSFTTDFEQGVTLALMVVSDDSQILTGPAVQSGQQLQRIGGGQHVQAMGTQAEVLEGGGVRICGWVHEFQQA
jgi:hypothetical protein